MGARVAVSVERANKASFFIGPSRKGEAGLRRAMGSDLTAGTGWASGRTELLCFPPPLLPTTYWRAAPMGRQRERPC